MIRTPVTLLLLLVLGAPCQVSLANPASPVPATKTNTQGIPTGPKVGPVLSTKTAPVPTLPLIAVPKPVPTNPWAWTQVPVTGNNAVYSKVRKQIDTAVAQGRDPASLLEKYRTAAETTPGDPVLLFRWAYAAYVTATRQTNSTEVFDCIKGLSDPRYAVAPVPSYDFNRVRFLIATLTSPNAALADLGRRLLAVNQDDDAVEYALAGILLDTYNPPKTVEALGLAQGLINQEPSRAEPYALVGEIYYLRWKAHHRENDGEQARQAYLQYVQLAPDSDGFKSKAASLAAAIGYKINPSASKPE